MQSDPVEQYKQTMTRRHFFGRSAAGLGGAALASLLPGSTAAKAETELGSIRHFAPKAKRAIYLFMAGAPSQIETFDYKPKLNEMFDKDLPESIRQGQRLTTMTSGQKRFPLVGSKFSFKQYGRSGAWVSELLPHTARMVDDLAIVKTVYTEAINHDPAITYICTGHQLPGRGEPGVLAELWSRIHEQRLAKFCGHDPDLDRPERGAGPLQSSLGLGVPGEQASRRSAT